MAATLNKVFLMGNLTRDPDVKQTPAGETVAELAMAISEQFRSRTTNELREVVTYVDVTVWGKVAENCGQYLTKGRPIFVEGRLVLDQWTDKDSGQKRTRLRVRADRVQFLYAPTSTKRDANGNGMSGDWAPANQAPVPPPSAATRTAVEESSSSAAAPVVEARDLEDLPF